MKSYSQIRRRGLLALASIVAAGALLAVPSTSPAAIDFGNNLSTASPDSNLSCGDTCTVFAVTLPPANTAAGGLTSPISGVVVSFTLKKKPVGASPSWSPIHLRVVHQISGDSWNGFTPSTPDVTPTDLGGEETFPVRLPITAGDYVALESDVATPQLYSLSGLTGAAFRLASPKLPADNSPGTATVFPVAIEILLRGRVEADADGDGFGDDTQDACPSDASTQGACAQPAGPVVSTPPSTSTGLRAAALKKCKKKHSKEARMKCKKKANLLPV